MNPSEEEIKRIKEKWKKASEKVNKEMAEILLTLPD